jgi:PAS domain S-box-containing protein
MGIFSDNRKKSKEGSDSDKKRKQLLQEFESKYHKLINTANYAIFIADAKTGIILDANKKAGELIGISPKKIIGMHQSKLHPTKEAKHYKKIFQEHIKSGRAISEDVFVINKSGEKIPVEISASVVEIGGKNIIQGIFKDITERKKTENELAQSEKKYRNLADNAIVGVYQSNLKGDILYVNDALVKMAGAKSRGEMKSITVSMKYKDPKVREKLIRLLKEKGRVDNFEFEAVNEKGELKSLLISSTLEGGVISGVMMDITDRMKADEKIKNFHQRLLTILDGINALVYVSDMQTYELLFVNKYGRDIWGDIAGKNCWETLQEEQSGPCSFCTNKYLVDEAGVPKEPYTWEFQNTVNNNVYFIIDRAIDWYDGRIVRLEIATDITDRKEADEALQASEERLRLTTTQVPAVLWTTDTELKFTSSTGAGLKVLGLKTNQVVGMTMSEYIQSDDPENVVVKAHRQALKGKITNYEFEWEGRVFDSHVKPLQNKEGSTIGTIGFALDVTERKKDEKALTESEVQFRTLAEKSPNMIFINNKGKVVFANEKCTELMGYSREEFYSPEFDFISLISPEHKRLIGDNFKRHMKGEEVEPYEYTLIARNGKRIDALQTSKLIEYGGDTALLGIITDISERKKAEDKLQDNIIELEKWQKLTVGREIRMTDLKMEIEELKKRLGKYESTV